MLEGDAEREYVWVAEVAGDLSAPQQEREEAGYECYGLFCAGCGGIEVEGW